MVKALEVSVSRDDARNSIKSVLSDAERIRQEYIKLLNDFYAPLEQCEEEYKRCIYRLVSIAKEDPDLSREMEKMSIFKDVNPTQLGDYLSDKNQDENGSQMLADTIGQ